MLTKNAYNLLMGLLNLEAKGPFTRSTGSVDQLQIATNNYVAGNSYSFGKVKDSEGGNTYASEGLYFGDGGTAPTINDYKLSGTAIKGVTYTSTAFAKNVYDGYAELQATVALTNTTDASVTIKEIGLFGGLYNTSSSPTRRPIMLDHTVLSTPITLAAKESKSITYNIRFTFPAA